MAGLLSNRLSASASSAIAVVFRFGRLLESRTDNLGWIVVGSNQAFVPPDRRGWVVRDVCELRVGGIDEKIGFDAGYEARHREDERSAFGKPALAVAPRF